MKEPVRLCDDELTIRCYRASDYPQVKRIWEAAGWGDRGSTSEAAIAYKLHNAAGPFLVAEVNGDVVGTAIVTWDGRWGWVSAVAVSPAHQRRGIARRLMAEAERALAELGAYQASLLVNRNDAAAMALYESLGYESFDFVVYLRKKLRPEEVDPCGH
jgi:ribosomal protein S18 acetylase RimI-like enzyme